MYHLACLLILAYVLTRFLLPLRIALGWKIAAAAAFAAGAMNRWWSLLLFGDMFSPELPGWMILFFGWLFGLSLFLALLCLVGELIGLAVWLWRGKEDAAALLHRWRMVSGLAAFALATAGAINGAKVPQVTRVTVATQGLPAEFEGFRIVQLSDLHISPLLGQAWVREVVARSNALRPDLVVVTGDVIDGTVEKRRADTEPLRELKARHGVLASLGNHEYYFDADRWSHRLMELGMGVLRNQRLILTIGEQHLVVAGTEDEAALDFGHSGPDAPLALASIDPGYAIVLLRHRPTGIAQSQKLGVDLQLSGHTHGGMVLGLDRVVAAANEGMVSGLYRRGTTNVYVSNGTGIWNGFLTRLGRPAEITEITLVRAP